MSEAQGWASIPNWMVRDSEINPHAKLLYVALSSRAGPDMVCWPSQATLAAETGMSESTVRRSLKALIDLGVVTVEVTSTDRGRRNTYRLGVHRAGGVRSQGPHPPDGGSGHTDLTGQVTLTSEEEPGEEEPGEHSKSSTSPTTPNAREVRGRMTNSWNPSAEASHRIKASCTHVDLRSATTQFKGWYIGNPSRNTARTQAEWDGLWEAWIARREEQWIGEKQPANKVIYDDVTGMPLNPRPMRIVDKTLTSGQTGEGTG